MDRPTRERPPHDVYFMGIALAVRERANCVGTRVGAAIALNDRLVAAGYNGTPEDMKNCDEGGCHRCANREKYPSGSAYDLCICVHAEQNALLSAARFGIPISGGVMYTTSRPCFGCTKELLQARIKGVYYLHDWQHPDEDIRHEYEKLQNRIPEGIRQVAMDDPHTDWAIPKRGAMVVEETGHSIPGVGLPVQEILERGKKPRAER